MKFRWPVYLSSSTLLNGFGISLIAYGTIACLPTLLPNYSGLDPSWIFGLNYASAHHWVFGKDIVFTYGPFGYLLSSLATEFNFFETYYFRIAVHFLLAIALIWRLLSVKSWLKKLVLLPSWLLLSSSHLSTASAFATEHQIVFLLVLLLSNEAFFQPLQIRKHALAFGAISGFFFLTKFTIGIYAFGTTFVILLTTLYDSICSRSNRRKSLLALIDLSIAAASVAYVLLDPTPLRSLARLGSCSLIASISSGAVWLIYPLLHGRSLNVLAALQPLYGKQDDHQRFRFSQDSAYLIYSIGLAALIWFSEPSLKDYMRGAIDMASGYSSGMSVLRETHVLQAGIEIVISVILLVVSLAVSGEKRVAIAYLFLTILYFKYGFTRQSEGHVISFSLMSNFIVAMCILRPLSARLSQFAYGVYGLTLCFAISVFFMNINYVQQPAYQNFQPSTIVHQFVRLVAPNDYHARLLRASQRLLSLDKLPDNVRDVIQNQEVDIIPWEINLVSANYLNWKPRPVFQSYSVYTQYLDKLNQKSLSKHPRPYLLYSFEAIDSRHPFFDEPSTFFYIFCHYRVSSTIPNLIPKKNAVPLLLLEHQDQTKNQCGARQSRSRLSVKWNTTQPIAVENGTVTRAAIQFKYSWLGKLYKTLFREEPIQMRINYRDGTFREYRIVPNSSENGVLISHLPRSKEEARSLLNGNLTAAVQSIRLSPTNPLLYTKTVRIALSSVQVTATPSPDALTLTDLKNVRFLDKLPADAAGNLDAVEVEPQDSYRKSIAVTGWAVRKTANTEPVQVLVTVDGNRYPLAILKTGLPRLDIMQFFKSKRYWNSGWSEVLSPENLAPGSHIWQFWIYTPSDQTAAPIGSRILTTY